MLTARSTGGVDANATPPYPLAPEKWSSTPPEATDTRSRASLTGTAARQAAGSSSRAASGRTAPGPPAARPARRAVPAMSPLSIETGRSQVIPASVHPAAQGTVARYVCMPLRSRVDSAATVRPAGVRRSNCTWGWSPGRSAEAVIVASMRVPRTASGATVRGRTARARSARPIPPAVGSPTAAKRVASTASTVPATAPPPSGSHVAAAIAQVPSDQPPHRRDRVAAAGGLHVDDGGGADLGLGTDEPVADRGPLRADREGGEAGRDREQRGEADARRPADDLPGGEEEPDREPARVAGRVRRTTTGSSRTPARATASTSRAGASSAAVPWPWPAGSVRSTTKAPIASAAAIRSTTRDTRVGRCDRIVRRHCSSTGRRSTRAPASTVATTPPANAAAAAAIDAG